MVAINPPPPVGKIPEPRKTWLDECAMIVMEGILSNINSFDFKDCAGKTYKEGVAKHAYDTATAMLAEKIKREAKE